jgi:uncharacterized protein YoxC
LNYAKSILLALLGKYAKTHEKQIAKAQKWIDSAQSQFASAIEEAELSEQHYEKVASDIQLKMDELSKVFIETMAKKNQAVAFKNKIKSFIE